MLVKICGITSLADAQASIDAGASMIGLNLAMGPRMLTESQAVYIAGSLATSVVRVGVFVNELPERVRRLAGSCGLSYVQLHGDEDCLYVAELGELRVIKAVRPSGDPALRSGELRKALSYARLPNVKFILVDARVKGVYGGTGVRADWSFAAELGEQLALLRQQGLSETRLGIAGGLGAANVEDCIQTVRPQLLDLSSGVESSPGRKDPSRIVDVMRRVQGVAEERDVV